MATTKVKSPVTIRKAIAQLSELQIIHPTLVKGTYWINPEFLI
jgi:DNA-binding GntR family transcriptional regulator